MPEKKRERLTTQPSFLSFGKQYVGATLKG